LGAAQRVVVGGVVLDFPISGWVSDKEPLLVDSAPFSIFNKWALLRIPWFKNNPKMVDGNASERPGVIVRLTFKLDD
jgi:hypothetical protein